MNGVFPLNLVSNPKGYETPKKKTYLYLKPTTFLQFAKSEWYQSHASEATQCIH